MTWFDTFLDVFKKNDVRFIRYLPDKLQADLESARRAALCECVSGPDERLPVEATFFDLIKHVTGELSALRRSCWFWNGFRSSDWPAGLNDRSKRMPIVGTLEVAVIEHADQRQNALSAGADAAALFC